MEPTSIPAALSGSATRVLLGELLREALDAVEPERGTFRQLGWLGDDSIRIGSVLLPRPKAVHLVSIGKAAAGMARGAISALKGELASVTLALAHPTQLNAEELGFVGDFRHFNGEHPTPGKRSLEAGEHLAQLARSMSEDELLLACVSGGASSMVCLPYEGISIDDIAELTRVAMDAGVPIAELNQARAAMDQLKFGGLAHLAGPADCGALILSDVPGDDLDLVGSGPTRRRAIPCMRAPLEAAKVWSTLSPAMQARLGSSHEAHPPAKRARFDALIGANTDARRAAGERAGEAGYAVISLGNTLHGDARQAALDFARACDDPGTRTLAPGRCGVVAGGEPTVQVRGAGRGGRTLEFGFAVAKAITGRHKVTVLCVATDGLDGNSGAAGVVVNGSTIERAKALGLDLERSAQNSDLAPAFEVLGDLVITGATGTNVCDLAIWLEE